MTKLLDLKRVRSVRATLGLVDQAVFSIGNMLAVLVFARYLSPEQFGVLTLGYAVFSFFLRLLRSYLGLPITLSPQDNRERVVEENLGVVLVTAPIVAVVVFLAPYAVAASHLDKSGLTFLLVLAVCSPALYLQDLQRVYLIANGRYARPLISDSVRVVVLIGMLVVGARIPGWLGGLVWAGSVGLALLSIFPGTATRPAFHQLRSRFERSAGNMREAVSVTVGLSSLVTFVIGSVVTLFSGPSTLGALRGSATLFGPMNTLIAYLDVGVLNRMVNRTDRQRRQVILATGLMLSFACAALVVLLMILPGRFGMAVLGPTWAGSQSVVPLMGLEYLFLAWNAALSMYLKATGRSKALLSAYGAYFIALVTSVTCVAFLGGDSHAIQFTHVMCALLCTALLYWAQTRKSRQRLT